MKKNKSVKVLIIMVAVFCIISLGGCSLVSVKNEPQALDAGVFKSADAGATWVHAVAVPTVSGQPGSIAAINVSEIVPDPLDNNALYLISPHGLFYSYSGASGWFQANTFPPPGGAPITALAIDPNDKCTIFAAVQNKIYKTVDCSRSWKPMHLEERGGYLITALAVDFEDSNIIYAGENFGDLLRSVDGGLNWENYHNFVNHVGKIMIDYKHPNTIYAATLGLGIFKSTDKGANWDNLYENMLEFPGANVYRDLKFIPTVDNGLIYASGSGIFTTSDGGKNWKSIKLLGAMSIFSVAIDPSNENIFYYATPTALYRTIDGGDTWSNKKLISTKTATALHIDPRNANIMYMGMTDFNPKK